MVYHVGRPAMLDGNRFLPETGTPIWKMLRSSTVFADCDPEPFTVATWMLKSFTLRRSAGICAARSCTPKSIVAMIVLFGLSLLYPLLCASPKNGRILDYKTVRRITVNLQ